MRIDASLPEGYRIREVEGYLYLFDAQGVPLVGPTDAATIEAYAWHDVWRRIDRELNEELADLRAGARPLHRLRRLQQYARMLGAAAAAAQQPEPRPLRPVAARWGLAAAAAAAVLMIAAARLIGVTEQHARPAAPSDAATALRKHQAAAESSKSLTEAPAAAEATALKLTAPAPHRSAVTARAVRRPVVLGYAVSFGRFADRAVANSAMHAIRRKGYLVHVAPVGREAAVITRPYRTRVQAERLVRALAEIGLPAEVTTARTLQ